MTRTIWKFNLPIADRSMVKMPAAAKVLTAQMQRGDLCLWVDCEPSEPSEIRHFAVYGTGNPLPNDIGYSDTYIATAQDGALVWHVYELTGV